MFILGFILASMLSGTVVHAVDTGALTVNSKPPYIHVDSSKATIKNDYPTGN